MKNKSVWVILWLCIQWILENIFDVLFWTEFENCGCKTNCHISKEFWASLHLR